MRLEFSLVQYAQQHIKRLPRRPGNVVQQDEIGGEHPPVPHPLTHHLTLSIGKLGPFQYHVTNQLGQPGVTVELVEIEFQVDRMGGNLGQQGFGATRFAF